MIQRIFLSIRIKFLSITVPFFAGVIAGVTTLGSMPNVAQAQNEGALLELEEIVVTARRREENLQDIPISMTALTAGELEARNVTNLLHINTLIPNLRLSGKGPAGGVEEAQVVIRGIGSSRGTINDENRAPIYLDGVYLGVADGGLVDVINVERIEVLRGPQGTLFGKNALSGAVHYISQKPGKEFGGKAKVTVGRFSRIDVTGHVDVPLTENLYSRITAAVKDDDGNGKSVTTGEELGDKNLKFISGDLLWEATDDVEMRLNVDFSSSDTNGPLAEIIAKDVDDPNDPVYALNGLGVPLLVATYNQLSAFPFGISPINETTVQGVDEFESRQNRDGVAKIDTWGIRLNVDWQVADWLLIKSLTSWREQDFDRVVDIDATQFDLFTEIHGRDHEQFQQEIQFHGVNFNDRLTWVGGLFFLDNETTFDRFRDIACELGALPSPPAPGVVRRFICPGPHSFEKFNVESFAIYGEGTYALTDVFSLTGGIRWTREVIGDLGSQITPPPFIKGERSTTFNKATPRVSLRAQWTDDIMTYFTYSEGFRSGGQNNRVFTSLPNNGFLPFDPETLTLYELGAKTQFFDKRLQVNVAIFKQDWEDMQVEKNLVLPPTFIPQNFFQNAGTGKSDGVEVEMAALLGHGLRMNAAMSYTDSGYEEIAPGIVGITLDSPFAEAPEWTYTIGGQWEYEPTFGGSFTTRIDYGWQDEQQTNADLSNGVIDDSFGLLSANVTYRAPSGRWSVSAFGTNLTDERYLLSGLSGVGQTTPTGTFGRQREWGVSLSFNF